MASKAVLRRTRNNNTPSLSNKTPIQHIEKPQRCALYIHCWSTSYICGIAEAVLDSSLVSLVSLPSIFQWLFRVGLCFLASVTLSLYFQLIFVSWIVSFFSAGIHSAKNYVQELSCFQGTWCEVQENKPKYGKVLGVYNIDTLPFWGGMSNKCITSSPTINLHWQFERSNNDALWQ